LRTTPNLDAYELNVSEEQLRTAPLATTDFFTSGQADRRWEEDIHRHYRATPYC
jgi:hypothetical protein